MLEVDLHAICTKEGAPAELVVHVQKLYSHDPAFSGLPYPDDVNAMARDRVEVTADSELIEIVWRSGRTQIVPLAFNEQNGRTFVLSGDVHHQSQMNIKLSGQPGEEFDVSMPTLTIGGHQMLVPTVHFRLGRSG